MKKFMSLFFAAVIFLCIASVSVIGAEKILKMSTTTSTLNSGLLDILLPEFEKDTGIKVKVIAKGTGAAIRDGIDGNVDIIFVHAQKKEEQFVKDGYGSKRYAVMHNDFIIIGPPEDPAGIKGTSSAAKALKKIAGAQKTFISRGDESGTHTKEKELWKSAGLDIENKEAQKWYLSIGQGMGKTLTFADEKRAYTLTDRGTYIKYKFGSDVPVNLDILCEGDSILANPYGVIPINPAKHHHVNYNDAHIFAKWLISNRGQSLINDYKLLGKQLFFPDALF